MAWEEGNNVLDISPEGDSVQTGFEKIKNTTHDVYDKLNRVRGLDASDGEPSDIEEGAYWVRKSDNTLMQRGATSSDVAFLSTENELSTQYALLMSIIFGG